MAVFFFLVGLEIKQELRLGSLASIRKAILPCIAAVGGMVTPMLVYAAVQVTRRPIQPHAPRLARTPCAPTSYPFRIWRPRAHAPTTSESRRTPRVITFRHHSSSLPIRL